jgi:hypothetical protein
LYKYLAIDARIDGARANLDPEPVLELKPDPEPEPKADPEGEPKLELLLVDAVDVFITGLVLTFCHYFFIHYIGISKMRWIITTLNMSSLGSESLSLNSE